MYPPYNQNPRYSPSAPTDAYSSNPPRPPYGYPPPPTLPPFRPYDAYGGTAPPRPPFPYDQPRPGDASEAYDPYRPSPSAYDPGRPSINATPSYPVARAPQYPASSEKRSVDGSGSTQELTVLTPPTTVNIEGHTTIVHALPPSQLPLTKYISVNRDDALDLHRHLTTREASIWYADGSNRAGEGWSAAVEWKFASGQSGSKMRGCVGDGDALDAELGGIYKAVEGFQELLRISLKDASPMPHHLIVFCDSQAAIVGIDTSTRPEAGKFDSLWREICTEFILAHLTLVWLPRDNVIEGHVLADKIAVVGASNAYLKKKKEGGLPDIYRRPGGGEPASPGSTHPGNWQRGEAEPGLRRPPFERPVVRQASPVKADTGTSEVARSTVAPVTNGQAPPNAVPEVEEEVPKEGSIFVTHFPEDASAKDLGILFSQYGSIESVDIYHVSPSHPRLAYVAFLEATAGASAIADLHRKAVRTDTAFAIDNAADFDVWRNWSGTLTVVMAEPPMLVPTAVLADFPDLPDWAKRGSEHAQLGPSSAMIGMERKRDRASPDGMDSISRGSVPPQPTTFTSPRKRTRTGSDSIDHTATSGRSPVDAGFEATRPIHVPDARQNLTVTGSEAAHRTSEGPMTPVSSAVHQDSTVITSSNQGTATPMTATQPPVPSTLPPTPMSAERPAATGQNEPAAPDGRSNDESKGRLTNSAAQSQEHPIRLSAKTLRGLIDLVREVFTKHESNNWIAHSCLIAFELDQARRALQGDLYATDEAFLAGREHERILTERGFTPQRVDAFITKVLKVLDGIAAAEDDPVAEPDTVQSLEALQADLDGELSAYPTETKEAIASAGRLMEYLLRGKELQEKKRLDIERRVKVLEGMVKVGEVVGGVVRFLLTEDN